MTTFGNPYKILPLFNGNWTGTRGDSQWQPLSHICPWLSNPGRQYSWQQILNHFGLTGIDYNQSLPDFDPIRTSNTCQGHAPDTLVMFNRITGKRWTNFSLADAAAIQHTPLTIQDMQQFRYDYNLTWHEEYNAIEMRLVFAIVHNNMSHTGGIAVINHHGHGSAAQPDSEFTPQPIQHALLGSGWQYETIQYFDRKTAEGTEFQLVFACESDQKLAPQQIAAYQFLQTHQAALQQIAATGLNEALQNLRKAKTDIEQQEKSPETTTPVALSFLLMQPHGQPCLGLLYDCSLDPEHGIGLLLEQTKDGYQLLRSGDQGAAL